MDTWHTLINLNFPLNIFYSLTEYTRKLMKSVVGKVQSLTCLKGGPLFYNYSNKLFSFNFSHLVKRLPAKNKYVICHILFIFLLFLIVKYLDNYSNPFCSFEDNFFYNNSLIISLSNLCPLFYVQLEVTVA